MLSFSANREADIGIAGRGETCAYPDIPSSESGGVIPSAYIEHRRAIGTSSGERNSTAVLSR